ncbi:class I SAM-dependent methyltransferase [Leptospira ellisii]|uniref:Class I SAM-dependent methyltransferase n=1 Tax=Leptospira ellisii TaxID=2023197 RepID=A0AAE4QKH0_9LEPT|nr:class I SAM-dependent methyltransferase [Leptospira ellisii]MDV6234673.1 class I SAM-dependent methyltransferase [Leptospira ellisii]
MNSAFPSRFRSRRYQLNRKGEQSVQRRHPWIYSGNLSTAVEPFVNGQRLTLYSTDNKPIATGIYSDTGMIRIRVIQFLPEFSATKIRENLISALARRNSLRETTNAYRLIHGENDFFPGITVDRIGRIWVVRIYSSSLMSYGRWIVRNLYEICKNPKLKEPQPKRILFDPPEKTGEDKIGTKRKPARPRYWRGATASPERTNVRSAPQPNEKGSESNRDFPKIRETVRWNDVHFPVELPGQKGGIFLDLRNLRKFLLENKKLSAGKDCLHLFSHTGLTSICMDRAGAKSVLSVDASKEALDSFQRVLSLKKDGSGCRHRYLQKNVFQELDGILSGTKFDLIVIDPPNLTPDAKSKKNALKSYAYLFGSCLDSLQNGGTIVLCSCSGRIRSDELESLARTILKNRGWNCETFHKLQPEPDHPVRKNFPEGNYFKVHIYENCERS